MADDDASAAPAPTSRQSSMDAAISSMIVKNPEGSTDGDDNASKPSDRRSDPAREARARQRSGAEDRSGSEPKADPLRRVAPGEGGREDRSGEEGEEAEASRETLDALLNEGVKGEDGDDASSDDETDDAEDADGAETEEGEQETDTEEAQDDEEDETGLLDADEDDDVGEGYDLSDDTRVSVTVEGKKRDVSLADLKKAYSGAGAIEARLQEVAEIRQTGITQLEENRDTFVRILEGVGELLFKPQTKAPDPALLDRDPMAYLMQKTKHEEEMQGINQGKQHIAQQLSQVYKDVDEAKKVERAEQTEILRKKMPILSDPNHGPQVGRAIVKMMNQDYGFSMDQIKDASFHGFFLMAADAMRYRVMRDQQSTFEVKQVTPKLPKKAAKTAVARRNAQTQQEKATVERARKTGSVDDVAATMIQKPKNRRGRRR